MQPLVDQSAEIERCLRAIEVQSDLTRWIPPEQRRQEPPKVPLLVVGRHHVPNAEMGLLLWHDPMLMVDPVALRV